MQFLYGRQTYFREFVPLPLLQPLQKFRGLHAEGLNLSTIYTPQIVVNGTSEFVGNNAGAVTEAISGGLAQSPSQSLIIDCGIVGQQLTVNYHDSAIDVSRSTAGRDTQLSLAHSTTLELPKDFTKEGWELIAFIQNSKDGHITAATKYNF